MKKFLAIFTAFIACFMLSTTAIAGDKDYRPTELGISIGTTSVLEPAENLIIGLDAVFTNVYVGLNTGTILGDGFAAPKLGYAFRLNFFESTKLYDAVVAPYISVGLYDGDAFLNYGFHNIFKLTNSVGFVFDVSPSFLTFGFSYAF